MNSTPKSNDEKTAWIRANHKNLPTITFQGIEFSDGTTIDLDPNDIVVFVGPNNAGKSLALRELEENIGRQVSQTVVKAVSLEKKGSVELLREFLEIYGRRSGSKSNPFLTGFGFNISDFSLEQYWEQNLDVFRAVFCMRIQTETRIIDSNPPGGISVLDDPPSHPIHLLYEDDRIEDRLSSYFRRAFGQDLILFRAGGTRWPLLTGTRPTLQIGEHPYTSAYNERLKALTVPLQDQGDGMRSFASVILQLLAPKTQSLLLLDEPEAFLHPPQARLLGEFIASEKAPHAQLFVATHSADVLQGLLHAAPEHLRVVRIQREDTINRVKELDKVRAKEISADPLMKFSSVMSGVFHERVIICESDADCMFYSSILDLQGVRGERQPDVLFVHAGGKHRMPVLAEALRDLDVIVDVIVDMDVLDDLTVLKRIVDSLGGSWSEIEPLARPLKTEIENHKPQLNSGDVAKGIGEILEKAPETGEFPGDLRAEIRTMFRRASPWGAIKEAGHRAIPSGDATTRYYNLEDQCRNFGLWMVRVGELEGWCKSATGHGPRFVQNVIENYDLSKDDELDSVRKFVHSLWSSRTSKERH